MNFLRASVLGRGQAREEGPQPGQQTPSEMEEQQSGSRLLGNGRPIIPGLFARLSGLGARAPPNAGESEDDGYKSQNRFDPSSVVGSRIQDMPNQLSRENGTGDSETLSQPSRTRTRTQRFPILTRPRAARTNGGEPERNVRRSTFNGSGLAELHLADLAREQRRRQRNNAGSSRRHLSLSITKKINTSEFSILLILLILLTAVFFCHSLIMLCLLFTRPQSRQGGSGNDLEANKYGHPGYAVPVQPIRVVLARDEEAAGIESEATKMKPPAYGLWRESVRVDPNRLYWQRARSPPPSSTTSAPSSNGDSDGGHGAHPALRRPPSYASDDGVDYVVDARPRSIAPPPSSIYSQSTMSTPAIPNEAEMPPLPHPALLDAHGPVVTVRLNNNRYF
ncbi:hypothetical protein FHL15_001867 [Xylaria flabelliformis]|uniref:Uncharacterized protein n=1 Tax=Xylaria flabelliformis TaxID=2512241 RepID=A0A553IA47_9PEZI|nr:hypothetical protein FHL15_001867 [Xylaria flabelliformis]